MKSQIELAPDQFAAKAQWDPQYVDLQNANVRRTLLGNGTAPGLLDTLETISPRLQASSDAATSAQRERDVADVARLGSKATEAIRSANPELTALRARLMSDATAGLDAGTGLSAEETRQTQQRARAAASARGFGLGPSDAISEVLARRSRGRPAGATPDVRPAGGWIRGGQHDRPVHGDSGPTVSGGAAGQSLLGQGAGNIAAAGAQKFDPFSAYGSDLNNTNYNADAAARIASGNATAGIIGAGLSAL